MIKYNSASEGKLSLFRTPYEQHLLPDNPRAQMEAIVPWDELAKIFIKSMGLDKDRASVDMQIIIGAMLDENLEVLSDEDIIRNIQENVCARFFAGLPTFQSELIFMQSLFANLPKRLRPERSMRFNDLVFQNALHLGAIKHNQKRNQQQSNDKDSSSQQNPNKDLEAINLSIEPSKQMPVSEENSKTNRSILKVDATVAPQNIGYQNDSQLLAKARKYGKSLIDKLYEGSLSLWKKKPRNPSELSYSGFRTALDFEADFWTKGKDEKRKKIKENYRKIIETYTLENEIKLIADMDVFVTNGSESDFQLSGLEANEEVFGQTFSYDTTANTLNRNIKHLKKNDCYDSNENRIALTQSDPPLWKLSNVRGRKSAIRFCYDDQDQVIAYHIKTEEQYKITFNARYQEQIVQINDQFKSYQIKQVILRQQLLADGMPQDRAERSKANAFILQNFHIPDNNEKVR